MTAAELIEQLQKLPPEIRVLVEGYEDGYDDIDEIKHLGVKLNYHEHWYYGAHEKSDDADAVKAVALTGKNKNAKDG